jgi:hypothetical protein
MIRKKDERNLLDLKPVRLVEHLLEGEQVAVLIPRFRSRWMGWLQRRLSRPYVKLRLDSLGTAVWLDCNGDHKVLDIGHRLKRRFGEEVEPVWDRLGLFLRQMRSGKLIDLQD